MKRIGGQGWSGTWRGDDVATHVYEASRIGIDATLLETVEDAKNNHPWQNRTRTLQRSHQQIPAQRQGNQVTGRWGVGEPYGFWLEVGTGRMRPFAWLRPAADRNYPKLPAQVREALGRLMRR